jgi:hypothetical protein
MKTLTKIFVLMLLSISLLQAAAFEKVAKSRTTKVTISSEKPLISGNNTINLSLSNEKYYDAKVTVKVFMPAMPGMPYMESKNATKNLGNGEYEADIYFSMGGTWQLHIFITPKSGKKVRVKSSVNI